jgi:hypothetical protein
VLQEGAHHEQRGRDEWKGRKSSLQSMRNGRERIKKGFGVVKAFGKGATRVATEKGKDEK